MSNAETLDLHNRLLAAADAREVPSALLAPGFRMRHRTCPMTDYTYRGPEGWREWLDDLLEEFAADARISARGILAAHEGLVMAELAVTGTAIHSATQIDFHWTSLTWFEAGRATRALGCSSASEAIAIAGIGPGQLLQIPVDRLAGPADTSQPRTRAELPATPSRRARRWRKGRPAGTSPRPLLPGLGAGVVSPFPLAESRTA